MAWQPYTILSSAICLQVILELFEKGDNLRLSAIAQKQLVFQISLSVYIYVLFFGQKLVGVQTHPLAY